MALEEEEAKKREESHQSSSEQSEKKAQSPERSGNIATSSAVTPKQIKQKRSFDEISSSCSSSIVVEQAEKGQLSDDNKENQDQVSSEIVDVILDSTTASNEAVDKGGEVDDENDHEMKATTTSEEGTLAECHTESSATDAITSNLDMQTEDLITFKVVYAKQTYEVALNVSSKIAELKRELFAKTGVTQSMQKLCFRGNLEDSKTLHESGLKNGVKVMMIGSKMDDIKSIDADKPETSKFISVKHSTKEPLCQQKQHRKIIDKGIPEYATPAWMNGDIPLPSEPLSGMTNKYGNKVRLTFKFETDEVWIGTKEHTQKLAMSNVKSVVSEPIDTAPQYHMLGLQIGPTEASRLWFYWVPSQYVKAIKRAILGD